MAKVQTRTISWSPSSSADVVSYKIYYTVDGSPVSYASASKSFPASKTSVAIPDEFPELKIDGVINIGVAAVDDAGNEADLALASAELDFQSPAAVTNLQIS